MKTLIMGILTVFVTVFIPSRAQAQLPDSLPIGSEQKVYDWIVTNAPVIVGPSIRYTDTSGNSRAIIISGMRTFESYNHLRSVITPISMDLLEIAHARSDIASTLLYYVLVRSYDSRGEIGFVIDEDVGDIEDVTMDSFVNAVPSRGFVTIWITNLSRVTIRSGVNLAVTDAWVVSGNLLKLDMKRCFGQEKMRVDLELSDGTSKTYTQFGEALTKPSIRVISPSKLLVSSCLGSDITIAVSDDLKNWTPYTSISCTETNTFLLDINLTGQCKFFNATTK